MKLVSYILILLLPLMCSKGTSENYDSNDYVESEKVYFEEASTINGLISIPSEASPLTGSFGSR